MCIRDRWKISSSGCAKTTRSEARRISFMMTPPPLLDAHGFYSDRVGDRAVLVPFCGHQQRVACERKRPGCECPWHHRGRILCRDRAHRDGVPGDFVSACFGGERTPGGPQLIRRRVGHVCDDRTFFSFDLDSGVVGGRDDREIGSWLRDRDRRRSRFWHGHLDDLPDSLNGFSPGLRLSPGAGEESDSDECEQQRLVHDDLLESQMTLTTPT